MISQQLEQTTRTLLTANVRCHLRQRQQNLVAQQLMQRSQVLAA